MPHILVIDDDEALRPMFGLALERNGHQVTLAENGAIGIEQYIASPPDLVITDIIMPEKEGVETILELRKQQSAVKIIAMSGGGPRSETYLQMCNQIGVCCTLAKPFSLEALIAAVDEALAS